jgi:hypothetical protein
MRSPTWEESVKAAMRRKLEVARELSRHEEVRLIAYLAKVHIHRSTV